jgi:hypothetical protein
METLEEGRRVLLSELNFSKFEVVSDEDGPTKISGVISIVDKANLNGRVYPKAVMETAIKKISENLDRHPGMVDHPEGTPSIEDVGIRWTNIYLDGDRVIGEGEIIPTRKGRDLESVIRAGIEVGISTRGYGTGKRGKWNGEDVVIIQSDYEMEAPDAVVDPSVVDARIQTIESAEEVDWSLLTVSSLSEHRPDLISEIRATESAPNNDEVDMENEENAQASEEVVVEKVDEVSAETTEAVASDEETKEAVEEVNEATEDAELTEAEKVKATLTEALADMTSKYEEAAARLTEMESEKQELAESVENWNAMLAAIAKQCHEDVDAENFYAVGDLAWMARMAKWGRDDEKYAAAIAAADGVESALKKIAYNNVQRYAAEKARPTKFAFALMDALKDCRTKEEVDAQFDTAVARIEAEMAGLPTVTTKGQVIEPVEEKKLPSDVEQAIEAMKNFGK